MNVPRRSIDPFPLEAVYDSPLFLILPAAARGMAMNLIWHFWVTDCRPLPAHDAQRFSISQGHSSTWGSHRQEIRAALDAILPELIRRRARRHDKLNKLKRLSQKSAAMARRRALEKAAKVSPLECSSSPAPILREDKRATRRAASAPIGGAGFSDKL